MFWLVRYTIIAVRMGGQYEKQVSTLLGKTEKKKMLSVSETSVAKVVWIRTDGEAGESWCRRLNRSKLSLLALEDTRTEVLS